MNLKSSTHIYIYSMNIIERLLRWANSLFEKKPDIVFVQRSKIIHWIDLQYKPVFAEHIQELNYLLTKCEKEKQDLQNLILRIKNHQPTKLRIDIAQKVVIKKAILLKTVVQLDKHLEKTKQLTQLHEIEQFFEELQNHNEEILKVRAQTSDVLAEHLEEYRLIMQVTSVLNKVTNDAITIFEKSSPYLLAIKQARKLEEILNKEAQYLDQIQVINHQIKIKEDEIAQIRKEMDSLEQDPRNKLEKSGRINQMNKNAISYYDLELKKKSKLIEDIDFQITALKEKKHFLNHNIITLNKKNIEQLLRTQIREDLNIEVKFSDKEVLQYNLKKR
jgi:hypothetical protein